MAKGHCEAVNFGMVRRNGEDSLSFTLNHGQLHGSLCYSWNPTEMSSNIKSYCVRRSMPHRLGEGECEWRCGNPQGWASEQKHLSVIRAGKLNLGICPHPLLPAPSTVAIFISPFPPSFGVCQHFTLLSVFVCEILIDVACDGQELGM